MAGLTTHVLDTARGKPAAGVRITLARIAEDGGRTALADAVTNADGRTDAPLIAAKDAAVGTYELTFYVGNYFRAGGVDVADPAFLDEVPIRFAIAAPAEHYHVPLLVAPWGYTTYRGS